MTPSERAEAIGKLLSGYRFAVSGEAAVQRCIEQVLRDGGYVYEREKHVSRKDRPDFMVNGDVAVEVKVDGSLTEVMRQISRYADREAVHAIVFVTTRATQAVRMPRSFCGKPVYVALLGGAFGCI